MDLDSIFCLSLLVNVEVIILPNSAETSNYLGALTLLLHLSYTGKLLSYGC